MEDIVKSMQFLLYLFCKVGFKTSSWWYKELGGCGWVGVYIWNEC